MLGQLDDTEEQKDGEEPIEVNADATAEEPKEVNPAKAALLDTIEKFSTKESQNEEH